MCVRCRGRGSEIHHRRSRAVKDQHQHCLCVLVLLCQSCHHDFAHKYPLDAKAQGLVVSKFVTEPTTIPVLSWHGEIILNCDGSYRRTEQNNV